MKSRGETYWPLDALHLLFCGGSLILLLALGGRVEHSWGFALTDLALLVILLVAARATRGQPRAGALARLAHGCLAIPILFTQVGFTIKALGRPDRAADLAELDRWIFGGVDPLEALEAIQSPWLTELMQWAYTAYLVLMPAIVGVLAVRGTPGLISRSMWSLLALLYLSYVGYYLVPASGPNIHNNFGPPGPCEVVPLPLYHFTSDLPGLAFARELRAWMFEVQLTKLDCFPSGHTAVAVACVAYGFRVSRGVGLAFLPVGVLVVLSTVYLRYHYVIDVIAGMALALFALTVVEAVHRRLERACPGAPWVERSPADASAAAAGIRTGSAAARR